MSAPIGQQRRPEAIELRGVKTHNLCEIDVDIPHGAMTVITGVSGSGKSSLAFDTLYAEGQRRFLESMSTYARQFLQRMEKPPLRTISNILPAIALRQRTSTSHARSTVGTITELDDHLQLLYAHLAEQRCVQCGGEVERDTVPAILRRLQALGEGAKFIVVAEVVPLEEEASHVVLDRLIEQGHRRFWLEGEAVNVEEIQVERLLDLPRFPVLIDRLILRERGKSRLIEAIEMGMEVGSGHLLIVPLAEPSEPLRFHRAFTCNECGHEHMPLIPSLFNPNSTIGACPACTGFGKTSGLDHDKLFPHGGRSLANGAVAPFELPSNRQRRRKLLDFCKAQGIDITKPWRELSAEAQQLVLRGKGRYKGVRGYFEMLEGKRHKPSARIMVARFRGYTQCESCGGSRLSQQARVAFLESVPLHQILGMRAHQALQHFRELHLPDSSREQAEVLLNEITTRLDYMNRVGLGYLTLERQARTLSGGELQRLHLTSSIGRALTDTLYVLDEPTAGLHARDSERLLSALHRLRDIGNTVVVVEHDPEIITGADQVIEIGPGGGAGGGQVLYTGDLSGLLKSDTATGRMLSAPPPELVQVPRQAQGAIRILQASENNLRDLDINIPLGLMVCVTGMSGSGKSTLVNRVLYQGWRKRAGELNAEAGKCEGIEGFEQLHEMVLMDQSSLSRSSRSNPATFTKAWDPIRKAFAATEAAKKSGITPGHFSFNVAGGRCENCQGTGYVTVEMHFMADVELQCESCNGRRFTDPVLAIRLREKNIADVLELTVDQALTYFDGFRAIVKRLLPLQHVGLGYLRLGQTTSTLSGGELQRLKLASYLPTERKKKSGLPSLFIFDEPTLGLHLQDIQVLIKALRLLVEEGHGVLVVEHNIDFIAAADHIIDLGPGGGDAGGQLVVEGSVADLMACEESVTGSYLKRLVEPGNGA